NNPNIANYEPFATVFLQKGSVVAWAILGIILALSLFHHRPFCNYFCATGAFLDSLSNLGRKIFRGRKT
ncbi:MAG: 4Fe-4S binding protein, partial [Candidatus Omnitrophota bacterium]|nr:4Fe-4S binding protein [Candidatus Omnitrophota bacterium]